MATTNDKYFKLSQVMVACSMRLSAIASSKVFGLTIKIMCIKDLILMERMDYCVCVNIYAVQSAIQIFVNFIICTELHHRRWHRLGSLYLILQASS